MNFCTYNLVDDYRQPEKKSIQKHLEDENDDKFRAGWPEKPLFKSDRIP